MIYDCIRKDTVCDVISLSLIPRDVTWPSKQASASAIYHSISEMWEWDAAKAAAARATYCANGA